MPGGARIPNYPAQCFIVDWSRGIANPPEGLEASDVFFITTRTDRSTYTVRYGIDRATKDGYVYLPERRTPATQITPGLSFAALKETGSTLGAPGRTLRIP
jgi:hypothetical protein